MGGTPLFALEDVSVVRGGTTVLDGVSVTLAEGAACAAGPSGGGKSTLLRLLNRLRDPEAGRILYRGGDVRDGDVLALRRPRAERSRPGVARQHPGRTAPRERRILEARGTGAGPPGSLAFIATFPGRHTAEIEGDFVVFLIGMRVNRPLRVRRWLPVFLAMPRMIRELSRHPEVGYLGGVAGFFPTGPVYIQYWRSFEDLERYARDPDAEHLPAWRRFNRLVRNSGDVGIWHETYRVRAGEYEAVYGNMPRVGLAAAGRHRPAGSTSTAARRIGARPEDEAPVAGY